jgi:hypothetical protein
MVMLNRNFIGAFWLACALSVAGCVTEGGTTDDGPGNDGGGGNGGGGSGGSGNGSTSSSGSSSSSSGPGINPTAFEIGNGLLPTCFWSNGAQKTLRALATGPLADANGKMPQMPDILLTCYDTIKYAVECALDDTQSVTNPHNNAVYKGRVGLAPKWRSQALDSEGRRWVTACMVQRLNALGLVVPIVLEADRAPLYESKDADEKYPIEESTAFGDLFSSPDPITLLSPAFTAYVCSEDDVALACVDVAHLLQLRLCDNIGLLCGVKYIGKCSAECVANGPYWDCSKYGFTQTIRVQTQENLCL